MERIRRKMKKTIAIILMCAMVLGTFQGVSFSSAASTDTGYTELTFSDFGIPDNTAGESSVSFYTPQDSTITSLVGTAISGTVTFSEAGYYLEYGGSTSATNIGTLASIGLRSGSGGVIVRSFADTSNGYMLLSSGTSLPQTHHIRVTFDESTESGKNVWVRCYLNGSEEATQSYHISVSDVTPVITMHKSITVVSDVKVEEEATVYDVSELGCGIAQGGSVTTTSTKQYISGTKALSYGDEVTFKVTMDAAARLGIGYGSYGVYFYGNSQIRYCNNLLDSNNNLGRASSGTTLAAAITEETRMKIKIEEQDSSYMKITLTIYADADDTTGTVYHINNVPRKTGTEDALYFHAVDTNAKFTLASTVEATYNEMWFGHWSESLGTSTYEPAPIYGLPEGTISSLDGVAISGNVSFPDTGARLRIGGKDELNHAGFWLWNDGGLWLSPQGIGGDSAGYLAISGDTWSAIEDTTFLLRLTFDDVGNGWAVGIYVNNTYIQTLTYEDVENSPLEPGLILGIEEGVTVDMTVPTDEYKELTLSDWGTHNENASIYGWDVYSLTDGISLSSLDGVKISGKINFNGLTGGECRLLIGGDDTTPHGGFALFSETDGLHLAPLAIGDASPAEIVVISGEQWMSYMDKEFAICLTFDQDGTSWTIGGDIDDGTLTFTQTFEGVSPGTYIAYWPELTVKGIEEEEPDTTNQTVFDFNGTDFDTSLTEDEQTAGGTALQSAMLATKVADTSTVTNGTGFTDGVYSGSSGAGYISTPVQFPTTANIQKSKIQSIKVRMYLDTSASATYSEFRIGADKALTGWQGISYESTGGVCGQWCDVDITNALVSNTNFWDASGNLQRFVLSIRVKNAAAGAVAAMAYFDNITIEWKEEEMPSVYKTLTFKDWNITNGVYNASTFYSLKDTSITSLDGYALEGFLNQNENLGISEIRLGGNNSSTTAMYVTLGIQVSGKKGFQLVNWHDGTVTKFEPDGWSTNKDMFVRFTFDETAADTWTIGVCVDGMYLGDAYVKADLSTGLLFMDTNMTLKDSGSQPIYKKVGFTGIDAESRYNTSNGEWLIYPLSTVPSLIPGTVDTTTFNVTYVIEDPSGNATTYEGTFTRVEDAKGLCLNIPQAQLPSGANGYAITIKEGEYEANDGSIGICILEDYDICLLDGTLDADYAFDNPQFTASVYCDLNEDIYVVSDADTVTIDGVRYNKGDSYGKAGVHTLTYNLYNHTYSRELILYSMGDSNEDNKVSAQDLVAMKKYASNKAEPTKAEQMASDITEDDVIAASDVAIMRRYLIQDSGLLVLTPVAGMETAKAGDAVAALIENYTPGKSDSIKTGEDIYHRKVTTLKWLSYENVSSYTVVVGTKSDLSDGITYTSDDCTLELMNLLADTDYYWNVSTDSYTSPIQTFHTADTVRTLTIEGITNTRDGGGWDTVDGGKIKQGMYYRGGQLEKSNDVTGITEEGKQFMLNQLGIKADLDLRGDQGGSALGQTVKYLPYSAPYYWGGNTGIGPDMTEDYKAALTNAVRSFADADNYPMYVHCSLGRDRTGTVCFLINALCGVSEQDLYLDYEMSMLSSCTGVNDYATTFVGHNFTGLYNGILGYAESAGLTDCTIQEAVEYYLTNRLGITENEIASIRELLVE